MFIIYSRWFLILCLVLFFLASSVDSEPRNNAIYTGMETVTKRLGQAFFDFSNVVTKFNELRESFSRSADSIEDVNIKNLFSNVMNKVNQSLQGKVVAIQKLAAFAEPRASDFYSTQPPKHSDPKKRPPPPIPPSYFNSKLINKPPEKDTDKDDDDDDDDDEPKKFNCTFPTDLPLARDEHFKAHVNMSVTSVHVPTSIYECDPPLLEALFWSSDLEETFKDNYEDNPTLSWQYFGSSTGFLRQYPASQWGNSTSPNEKEKEPPGPDLYDCRFRPWYTASASSPKNLLILLDSSGSMTGMKRRIAKSVVSSILDTLTENDYVNVFNFSVTTDALVECTNDSGTPVLLQANLKNLRDLRVGLEQRQTKNIADFNISLTKAFETLDTIQSEIESANCNQAIMIVTDGAPDLFKDFFDKKKNEGKKIRIFTYLVGRDDTDKEDVQGMACYNQGFFAHVASLGEVQEQVVKYLHVMSRPLVMSQRREVNWTPVYASHVELIESEWQWQDQIRERQRTRSGRYRWFYQNVHESNKNKSASANKSAILAFSDRMLKDEKLGTFLLAQHKLKIFLDYDTTNITDKHIRRMKAEKERIIRILQDSREGGGLTSFRRTFAAKFNASLQNQLLVEKKLVKELEFRKFNFVVSASYPVFELRNVTNSSTGSKDWIANFLGVVGTDISIDTLKNLASPFELGVNAYSFAITNNGQIVFHPEFRPLYENILKPTYNFVDLTDVELVDKEDLVVNRNRDNFLIQMRKDMIDKESPVPSEPRNLAIRIQHDNFRRVSIRNHVYVFGRIPKTFYTLAIQVPQNTTTYNGEIEVSLQWKDKGINIVDDYFDITTSYTDEDGDVHKLDRTWKIHPDWTYCQYLSLVKLNFTETKEDTLVLFIKRIQAASTAINSTWSWGWEGIGKKKVRKDGDNYICDKKLVQSVVFDALITKPFAETTEILNKPKVQSLVASSGAELLNEGILTTFIATRSGLTRWVNHPNNNDRETPTDLPFTEYHPRAIEESWYQRSVDRAWIDEDSYIVSVPFDAGTQNYSRVTVTRAIIATKDGKKAPVAVAGVQYDLDKFLSFFGIGPEYHQDDSNICQEDDVHCFLLDESAFVIGSSETRDDAGQFFGEVNHNAMEVLIDSSIYKEVKVVDFQGICFQPIYKTSIANALLTPVRQLIMVFNWIVAYFTSFLLRLNFPNFLNLLNFPSVLMDSSEYEDQQDVAGDRNMLYVIHAYVNKTKLRPCDIEYKLFMYGTGYRVGGRTLLHKKNRLTCEEKCDDYVNVQRIPHTNLILVIVEDKCHCGRGSFGHRKTIHGQPIEYPVYHKFINKSVDDPILELCRIIQTPLHRKRISYCNAHADFEVKMKDDCGRGMSLKVTWFLVLFPVTFSSLQLLVLH